MHKACWLEDSCRLKLERLFPWRQVGSTGGGGVAWNPGKQGRGMGLLQDTSSGGQVKGQRRQVQAQKGAKRAWQKIQVNWR